MHIKYICKHGYLVSQCRCIGTKNVQVVACPDYCPKKEGKNATEGESKG